MNNLLPCPFCGSADIVVNFDYVECRACQSHGPYVDVDEDEQSQIKAWNERDLVCIRSQKRKEPEHAGFDKEIGSSDLR